MNVLSAERTMMMSPRRPDPADQISELRLVALPVAVGRARRFARHQLHRWGMAELTDDVELLVSELLTNAVKATGTLVATSAAESPDHHHADVVIVRFRLAATGLYIEVWDTHPGPPVPARPADSDERGRGMGLVMALSDAWGHYPVETGKVVWVRIAH